MTAPDVDIRRIGDVADAVGISKQTLWRWAKKGLIQLHHQGCRMTFVSMAEVQGCIKNKGAME